MKARKILFPIDYSTCGDEALELATSLARDTGAKLLIAHVEEPPMAYGSGHMYYGTPNPTRVDLQKMLHEVVPSDPQVDCEYHLLLGHPAKALLKFADAEGVDTIVMGTHGRTGILHMLMGSVAENVVRHAKCPVVTVKHQDRTPAQHAV